MQIDKITFNDISIFHPEEEFSIFHKLNFTRTLGGKEWLRRFFSEPHPDLKRILGTQAIIKVLLDHIDEWPTDISNGTILVMDKFLDYSLDPVPESQNAFNSLVYKVLHGPDYSMIKYSVKHFADFYRGMRQLADLLSSVELPAQIQFYIDRISRALKSEPLRRLSEAAPDARFNAMQNLYFAYHLKADYRSDTQDLMEVFHRLDAWYSMAMAVKKFDLHFPKFIEQDQPYLNAKGLYHVLLEKPVAYDLMMNPDQNFLFLTGANMAGKSTLIKAVGSSVFLAHMGMGVPAKNMELTVFDGLLSNINVVDNIAKGESFFFNEVQRIKNTINKINDGKKWLVLIDELFKGTNVQDAMKCSLTVIKGLIKMHNSLFILSTHLYEIGEDLKQYPNIAFKYFETNVHEDQLSFSYQLKEGISNDRIGYVILKREKVVEMLEKL
ncbi:DNA mismatch repair protein MutS [Chitinophagaceae bacterium LB-8]|uniref:DNA mismatch repair protein MutS n=1 Tax=Paraflavisolibacter caeni TaxID=2982496 RepID=A0A9X3BGF8_9BACT|nr:DNA mismatch repair protein MutS [Paraflavisolibacter caeni]MCU7547687.1 DNA mismatch repair protein MutS [Paraflavisolibacter caeni]